MKIEIKEYIKDRMGDVLAFEKRLREEEDVWGWEIDEAYVRSVEKSFDDPAFQTSISLLAYVEGHVVGRIDSTMIASHFDGSKKAYLDWICVLKSYRHQQVAQNLLMALIQRWKSKGVDTLIALTASNDDAQRFYKSIAHSEMRDIGIWIDINQYEKL